MGNYFTVFLFGDFLPGNSNVEVNFESSFNLSIFLNQYYVFVFLSIASILVIFILHPLIYFGL